MAVINDLPMVDGEQKDIEYTWAEEAPGNGYTLTSQEKKGTLTTITNSLPPETTGLSVQKIWEDDGNAHQTRPNEIKVQLYADGKACGEAVVLNAANSWKAEWTGLDKFVNDLTNIPNDPKVRSNIGKALSHALQESTDWAFEHESDPNTGEHWKAWSARYEKRVRKLAAAKANKHKKSKKQRDITPAEAAVHSML